MNKVSIGRFGAIGAVVTLAVALLAEAILWFKFVPSYNALFVQNYGVSYIPQFLKYFAVMLVIFVALGFVISLISAWLYNKLQRVQIK